MCPIWSLPRSFSFFHRIVFPLFKIYAGHPKSIWSLSCGHINNSQDSKSCQVLIQIVILLQQFTCLAGSSWEKFTFHFLLKKNKDKNSLDEPFESFNISVKYFFWLHLQSWFNFLPCWCQRKKQENWKRYPL